MGAAVIVAAGLAGCGGASSARPTLPPDATVKALIDTHAACPTYYVNSPQWSPDGQTIIYVGGSTTTDIHQVHVDGSDDHIVAEGGLFPALSPDGKLLMFGRPGLTAGTLDYFLVELATGKKRLVALDASWAAWSPDGKSVVAAPGKARGGPIQRIELATNQVTPLTDTPAGASADKRPEFSPDGQWIAFESNRDGPATVYILPAGGGEPAMVEPPDDHRCVKPRTETDLLEAWLPDSSGVAVLRSCEASLGLVVYDTDGQKTAEWPDLLALDRTLDWSADGSLFLFGVRDGEAMQVFIAQADGSGAELAATGARDARWSPDMTRIVSVDTDANGRPDLALRNPVMLQGTLDSGDITRLTHNPGAGVCLH